MDLEGIAGRFAGTILAFFTREDQFPYYKAMIHDYEEDYKNFPEDTPREVINDHIILKWCRALVHSKDTAHVKEGIEKLEGIKERELEDASNGVPGVLSSLQKREMLYLLAVGYYRRDGKSKESLSCLEQCLEIAPHFNQALTLKKKFRSALTLSFLIGGDYQYYRDMILDCERDIAEAGDDSPNEVKIENIIKLSWALVHTRQPEDVQRGMAMLEAPLKKFEPGLFQGESANSREEDSLEKDGLSKLRATLKAPLKKFEPGQLQGGSANSKEEDSLAKDELRAMLEDSLEKDGLSRLHIRDMLYIRSLGHYINRDFVKSRWDVYYCLKVAPGFWQGWYLHWTVADRMEKDRLLGAFIFYAASAVVPSMVVAKI